MRGSNQNRKFNQPYWTGCVCRESERGGFVFLCVYAVLGLRIRDKLCTSHPHPYPAGDLSKFIEIVHQATASLSLGFTFLVGGEWQCPWRWRRHSLKFSQLVLLANAIKQHWAVKRVTIQTKCHKSHRVTVVHSERECRTFACGCLLCSSGTA